MYNALVSAGSSTESGFRAANLLVLIVLFAVAWPLFKKIRTSVSANRKRRWVEEGLMDPPAAPHAGESSDYQSTECRRRAASAIEPDIDG